MSENLDELLDIADEENEGDYDLGVDEEEALLDENYDISNKTHSTTPNDAQTNVETEQDILELDDETELNDEDTENLNSTTEEENRCRKDKFSSERIVPQKEQQIFVKKFKPRTNILNKQGFCGGFNNTGIRGRRGGNRGNFHNVQNKTFQYHQRNKVLINPHFKGNVQIKHNVSLAWDKNNSNNNTVHKKPVIHIQPWAQQPNPEVVQYQQGPICQDVCVNQQYNLPVQNTRLPVHQRLGISSNIYNQVNQSLPDNQSQYVHNLQQPAFQQVMPQNQYSQPPMYNQMQYANNYNQVNQFAQPIYNNVNKPVNTQFQSQNIYPVNPCQPIAQVNYNQNQNYPDYHLQNTQPDFVPSFNNNPIPKIVNYPPTVPVVSNETLNVDVSYFEEQEQKFQPVRKFSGGNLGKRKFDYKHDMKKKRTVLPSNLHEVKTIDVKVFQDTSTMFEDKNEEVTYRRKIEHQKRMREKLLRQKEERRKQAARLLQAEEQYKAVIPPTDILKEEIPVITTSNKIVEKPSLQVTKLIKKAQIVRTNNTIIPIKTIDNPFTNALTTVKRLVTAKPTSCENVSTENSETEILSTSFLSNRKIFAKDKSLIDTSLVVVNNLATGTSEVKLRKLCQGVGDIQVRVVKPNCI